MIGLLAVFGILLNAGLIVRHHSVMVQSFLQPTVSVAGIAVVPLPGSLEADLRVICQGGSEAAGHAPAGSGDPAPAPCPLCMGQGSAFATIPFVEVAGLLVRPVGILHALPRRDDRVEVQRRIRPPGRAPPMTT